MASLIRMWLFWFVNLFPRITINVAGKPYLTRYYLLWSDRNWGNIYVHHFHSSDQKMKLHNHPWSWGLSFVLSGGYYEERVRNPNVWTEDEPVIISDKLNVEKRDVKPGSFNMIRTSDFHRVDLKDEKRGAWSIFFAGPRSKDWGFLDRNTSEFKHFSKNPEAIP